MLKSFRSSILILMISCTIIPIGILGTYLSITIYNISRESAEQNLQLLSQKAADRIRFQLQIFFDAYDGLRVNQDVILSTNSTLFSAEASFQLGDFMLKHFGSDALYILDNNFEVVVAYPELLELEDNTPIRKSIKDMMSVDKPREMMTSVHANEKLLLKLESLQGRSHSEWESPHYLLVASPLRDKKQRILGYLASILPIERLLDSIRKDLKKTQFLELEINGIKTLKITEKYDNILTRSAKIVLHSGELTNTLANVKISISERPEHLFTEAKRTTQFISLVLVLTIAICLTLSAIFSRTLSHPINRLIPIITNFGEGRYKNEMPQFKYREFNFLGRVLKDMKTSILEHQDSLEKKIEARTRQLKKQQDEMRVILENMQSGIVNIDDKGLISSEYSQATEVILRCQDLKGQSIFDLIFARSNLSEDMIHQVQEVLTIAIYNTELNFITNQSLLPHKINLNIDGETRQIELEWDPVTIDGVVESFLITIRDTTEVQNLLLKTEAKDREIQIMMEVLRVETHRVDIFFQSYREVKKQLQAPSFDLALAKRSLHTLKGNSRSIGFRTLSTQIHSFESQVEADPQAVRQQLDEMIELYQQAYQQIYDTAKKRTSYKLIDKKYVRDFLQDLQQDCQENVQLQQRIAEFTRSRLQNSPHLADLFQAMLFEYGDLCRSMEKPIPKLQVEGGELPCPDHLQSYLFDIFNHLLANCIVHGIEIPAVRVQKGKDLHGHIYLKVQEDRERLSIHLSDDGGGIPLRKLAEITQTEIDELRDDPIKLQNLLVQDGVTTADNLNQYAGRGIGLAAVATELKQIDGKFIVQLGSEANEYVPISFLVEIPLHTKQMENAS